MSHTGLPHDAVFYPTSDGQPMAETDLHAASMVYVACALRWWFERHGRADVYVGSNNFLYYEQGNPGAVVAPDVYVVVGAPAHLRDTYMLWNEPKGPDFVLEVTSKSTRGTDERRKREVYAALGVSEYFLYDPRAEYLTPPLQGWRLHQGAYRALPAVTVLSNRGTAVTSEVLGLELRDEREARMLRLHDRAAGEDLLTYKEEAAARKAVEVRAAEEAATRKAVEVRAAEEAATRKAVEVRAAEEAATRKAAEVRAGQAEVRAGREAEARAAAEAKVAELQAQLRALQDERARNGNGRP